MSERRGLRGRAWLLRAALVVAAAPVLGRAGAEAVQAGHARRGIEFAIGTVLGLCLLAVLLTLRHLLVEEWRS